MGIQDFKPDSDFGNRLKEEISNRLISLNVEDPTYVAEYLLLLISNNRSPAEIVEEFTGLFGAIVDQKFVQDVINEILSNQGQSNALPSLTPQQPQQQFQQPPASAPSSTPVSAFTGLVSQPQTQSFSNSADDGMVIDGGDNKEVRFSDNQLTFKPNNFNSNNGNNNRFNFTKNNRTSNNFKSSRGRGGTRGGRPMNNRRQDAMSKMIEMSLDNNDEMTTNIVSDKPRERCKDFPHCANRICPNVHPTKMCRAYPNCPNVNQTCTYLHPGEDDELLKEYERVREAKYQQRSQHPTGNVGITLCKFGSICQKELCPFGHPTPANKDAKVTILQWCVDNKECKDPTCTRAHSSPNFKPSFTSGASSGFGHATQTTSSHAPLTERTLEQCKFGSHCKNFRCPKRHATSSVMCRDGAACVRIDCSFMHPLNEPCKYGVNCTNTNCAFQHPEGRQISEYGATPVGNKVWINGHSQNTGSTAQRQFAVSEDQVLEQAPIQEV